MMVCVHGGWCVYMVVGVCWLVGCVLVGWLSAGGTHFAPGDWVGVALDSPAFGRNDGTVHGWLRVHRDSIAPGGVPLERARVQLPGGGEFALRAYVASRADMTEEFEARRPGMNAFVLDWLRARGSALTAKDGR